MALMSLAILINVSLLPAMSDVQGRFALSIGQSHDFSDRVRQSGNPFLSGTWYLHYRLAKLSPGELLLPPNHRLDTTFLDQVVGVSWAEVAIPDVAPALIAGWLDEARHTVDDLHGSRYRIVPARRHGAAYVLLEVPAELTKNPEVVRWLVLPASELIMSIDRTLP